MGRDSVRRRCLLQAGGLALATILAGCTGGEPLPASPGRDPATPPSGEDDQSDGPTAEQPDEPPAVFKSPTRTFSFNSIPFASTHVHPDSRVFTVTIDDDTAIARFEQAKLRRPLNLTLTIHGPDGPLGTARTRLNPDGEDGFKPREIEFDISSITLPTRAGGQAVLTGKDSHPGAKYEHTLKTHHFVGIEHDNGVHWVNTPSFNTHEYIDENRTSVTLPPSGVWDGNAGELINRHAQPGGYINYADGSDGRTVFLATHTSQTDSVFGLACTIPHDAYNQFIKGGSGYRWRHGMRYENRFATDIAHLQDLAETTHSIIDGDLGVTDTRTQLEILGDLVQMLPYDRIIADNIPPSVTLYEQAGDCSNKAGLYTAILRNDPWNIRTMLITCRLNGQPHAVPGIDVRDFDATQDMLLASPTPDQLNEGYPDTQYAFFDMTYDSDIGQSSEHLGNNLRVRTLEDLRAHPIANNPPNY